MKWANSLRANTLRMAYTSGSFTRRLPQKVHERFLNHRPRFGSLNLDSLLYDVTDRGAWDSEPSFMPSDSKIPE